MSKRRVSAFLLWVAASAAPSWAQTQIDLKAQSKNVDFTQAPATRPVKTGASLPSTCQVGEIFFRTGVTPGNNLYGCTSTNQWTLQAGGGGGSGLPDMTGQANKVLSTDGAGALWRAFTTGPTGALEVTHSAGDVALDIVTAVLPQKSAANTFTGLNTYSLGLQLGETPTPGSPADGRIWYDATSKTFRCRQNGVTYDCIGSGGGGGMTPSSTDTLTNKTIDAEAAGNVVTLSQYVQYQAANCQGTAAALGFAAAASGAPTAACVSGASTIYGVAQFADADAASVQGNFSLPPDWTGNLDFDLRWRSSAASGSVVWQLQTACAAEGESGDPAWNAAQTLTDAAQAVAWRFNDAALAAVTTAGCAPGEQFFFKFLRDPAHASDTLGATAELLWLRFKLRRAQ